MARFSELAPSVGRYVNGADRAMLASDPDAAKADDRADSAGPVALRLMRVAFRPSTQFGPQWSVEVSAIATGEAISIDFAGATQAGDTIESRASMFGALRDRLDAGEAFEPVILARVEPAGGGNPFWTFLDCPVDLVAAPIAPVWLDDEAAAPSTKVTRRR